MMQQNYDEFLKAPNIFGNIYPTWFFFKILTYNTLTVFVR